MFQLKFLKSYVEEGGKEKDHDHLSFKVDREGRVDERMREKEEK